MKRVNVKKVATLLVNECTAVATRTPDESFGTFTVKSTEKWHLYVTVKAAEIIYFLFEDLAGLYDLTD